MAKKRGLLILTGFYRSGTTFLYKCFLFQKLAEFETTNGATNEQPFSQTHSKRLQRAPVSWYRKLIAFITVALVEIIKDKKRSKDYF